MSIIDYLYKGAPAGERAAVQAAVQNMPYSTIGKNIMAEGAFGMGKNLKGFDFNYKGKGALPANTFFQKYVQNPATYIKGGITSVLGGNAPGNIGGATLAQRQLFEKLASSPFSKFTGPVARSAISLPMSLAMSGPYAMYQANKPSTQAGYDYVKNFDRGAITGIMDEVSTAEDITNFFQGMKEADAAALPVNESLVKGGIIDATPVGFASQMNAARNALQAPTDSRLDSLVKNTIGRNLLLQGGATAGGAASKAFGITNPLLVLGGAIGSQFLPLSDRVPKADYDYINQADSISLKDGKIQGGVLSGKNLVSGFGSNNLGTMYQNFIDDMTGRGMVTDEFGNLVFDEDELTTTQQQKLKDAQNQLRAYLTTGRKMKGYRTPDGKSMTDKEFAFNYNQGIGQFALPDYDALDQQSYTEDLGGGEFTDSMGNVDYSDPYDPGGGE